MSRVALARIPSLTFYKDAITLSRRDRPIPQLVCKGKACDLYQPEVVRCANIGGGGTEVDWKCEADLPESLRFGRVEVSCEGWSGPGDPYVLKGSCSLEYRLVQVPSALRTGEEPSFPSRWFRAASQDPLSTIFTIIWTAILLFILYSILKSCFSRPSSTSRPGGTTPRPSGGFPGSGWFPGAHRPDNPTVPPPPPYSKYPSSSTAQDEGWRPGFWTGAALGGLGSYLFNRRERERTMGPAAYDWERDERLHRPLSFVPRRSSSGWASGWGSGWGRQPDLRDEDRGEGPSDLGRMRRSTGLGGSNVR
ncbi:hypothetical protein SCP_1302370 [Sparassis crispa]|uniref:Store-operated calcium entry-associated regulatory factor n=1 Tax=Sparassis crispa TaxID=139825 RepID=A0A401H205_9APHY|nr:hypothetical protein SCP_1302370 [Sparassis crispa]GBE88422.1 hypothetical protein SCP_1302370 [Sparassis crispa]